MPFWRQIHDQLAERIRAGVLPPRSPLSSVRQLAADSLVSVITVKQAFDELDGAGLGPSHQGRGTFVAESGVGASQRAYVDGVGDELAAIVRRARAAGVEEAELDAACENARGSR